MENRSDPHRWRGPATIVSPDGDSRYLVSWRGRVLLTARDQLRLATAEESAAAATIGEDALLTKETVHEDEDKRAIDVSEYQPVPPVPERPEIREAVYRGKASIKDAIREDAASKPVVKDVQKVRFKLPVSHRLERKALADARRMLGLPYYGRR